MSDPTRIGRPVSGRDPAHHDTEPQPRERPSGEVAVFSARYREGPEIARGGMGRVVEATDIVLDRTVALKEALGTGDDALRRFARETRITARLEHPSIVPVYDAGVAADGTPYYVMRKISGRPLENLAFEKTALIDRLALLPHLVAAAQAVAHAHRRGVIHRDIKPSNILVGDLGETIVIDWGLAKVIGETDEISAVRRAPTAGDSLRTQFGSVLGTPGFMPPEQIESSDVDERADVYALGASLYYLLARRPPHAADSGDAMMLAAVEGPPVPIERLVRGVPRELASICDKALAHRASRRYANAGELAEDLRQFLAGQLVASHRYSPRERLGRFVRKHRALVITIAAAAALLAAGAVFSVGRILAARDEAVAQAAAARAAQEREAARAADLVLSQARLLLENRQAAAAIALARPFAGTERWREARAIAAGARAQGVPWRLPSSPETASIAMSPDGTRAISCGTDGVVRIHDLAARQTRTLTQVSGRPHAIFIDADRVAIRRDRALWIHDLRGAGPVALERPTKIALLAAARGTLYGADADRRAWRLDPGAPAAAPIAIDADIRAIAASPAGDRVAFGGKGGLWLATGAAAPERLATDEIFDIAWDLAAPRLVAMSNSLLLDVALAPAVSIERFEEPNSFAVLARGYRHTAGLVRRFEGRALARKTDLGTAMLGLQLARGDLVVHAEPAALGIADGPELLQVPLPASPSAFAASPRSPYVLAAARDQLLLWNVDDFMPRRISVPAFAQLGSFGAHDVVTGSISGPAKWLDAATGAITDLAPFGVARVAAPPSGALLLILPLAGDRAPEPARLAWRGGSEPLPFSADLASFVDENRIAYVTKAGQVSVYDRAARRDTPLGTLGGPARALRHRGSWLAVGARDDRLLRFDLATQRVTQTRLAATDRFTRPAADGRVWLGRGERIYLWHPGGALAELPLAGVLPAAIETLLLVDDDRAIVACADASTYLVSLAGPVHRMEPAFPLGTAWAHAEDAGLLAIGDREPGIQIVDLAANTSWRIALSLPPRDTSAPTLTEDGFAVIARASIDAEPTPPGLIKKTADLQIWPLALPRTAADTARWIEGLTNAEYDPRLGKLSWR